MNEKRKDRRTPVELAASAGVDGSTLDDNLSVKNVSQGGFCFQSERLIEPGSEIQLAIELNDGGNISINVKAVWYQKNEEDGNYLIGVQIINTSDRDIEKFLAFYNDQISES